MPRVTITIADNMPQPYRFPFDRKTVTIGRGSENDIAINCPSVSVKHAIMERYSNGYRIRDLDSTNGTKMNGVRESVILLEDGYKVVLGDVAFDFQLSEEEKLALADIVEKKADPAPAPKPQEEEKPKESREKIKSPPRSRPQPAVQVGSPLQSAAMFFCFFVLAALAFYIGLSLRYQKETGGSLLESIVNKDKQEEPKKAPVSTMPADSEPAELAPE
jgi:pSer/pThr/pTyr-binding forkhead associated (FHA) protein